MSGLNMFQGIGYLGRDGELRYSTSGHAVINLSLGITETWKDKNGAKKERTEWVRCALWGKTAEALADYLLKGRQVYVQGRLQSREWNDKDGVKHRSTEVNCDNIVLLGSPGARRRSEETPSDAADVPTPDTMEGTDEPYSGQF